jgi:hypothetical protein
MKTTTLSKILLWGARLLVSVLLPSSAWADCSGRCLVNLQTGQPYCSLSLFGTRICVEGVDYCAEFACPYGLTGESESQSAGLLQPAGQCQQASAVQVPAVQVKVVTLKART